MALKRKERGVLEGAIVRCGEKYRFCRIRLLLLQRLYPPSSKIRREGTTVVLAFISTFPFLMMDGGLLFSDWELSPPPARALRPAPSESPRGNKLKDFSFIAQWVGGGGLRWPLSISTQADCIVYDIAL